MSDLKFGKAERPVSYIMLDKMIDNLFGESVGKAVEDVEELEVVSDKTRPANLVLSAEEVARIEASLHKCRCEENEIDCAKSLNLYTEQR